MDMISPADTSAPASAAAPALAAGHLARLERFFAGLAPASRPASLSLDTELLTSGLLDSLGILQLTVFLGEEYGIEIGDEDFTLENFGSVRTLVAFIDSKQSG